MPDYRVRAVWDLGNAAQFEQGVKSTVDASSASIKAASALSANPAGEVQSILSRSEALIRSFYSNVKPAFTNLATEITDPTVNASLSRSIGLLDSQILRVRTLQTEFRQARNEYLNPGKYSPPGSAYQIAVQETAAAREAAANLPGFQSLRRDTASATLAAQEQALANATVFYKGGQSIPGGGRAPAGGFTYQPPALVADVAARREELAQMAQLEATEREQTQQNIQAGLQAQEAARQQARVIAEGKVADLRVAGQEYVATQQGINAELKGLLSQQQILSPDLAQILRRSPQATRILQNQGFGVGPGGERPPVGSQQLNDILSQQGATVTGISRDTEKGITTLGVSYRNLDQNATLSASGVQKSTIAIKDNGEAIVQTNERLAQSARAAQQAGDQYTGLARVIQRTVEYAVVAAAAYGAFNAAVGQIHNINELNTGLTRLGITAKLSATETASLFDSLAQVSYQTATPLNELVKSADDIALAVRRAGQSTEEYKADIISLTQAVGILTNLSGVDTVTATDQLSSAFKQLAVAPGDLIGILDKITAVAGGQSTAIADIVAGLGSVASAAHNAGLSTDEMIASLQVLGQVTNKTPDELAASFKALFGALISPGSIKSLHAYGIEVKDAAGNVRPFLQVYKDISDAISKGIIPSGQIEAVTRAISGGPRRAPDAAAFLDNINRVYSVVATSQNATNEALVANAKILDTNQAKLVQLQTSLEAGVYKAFGKTISDITSSLLSAGIALTHIFEVLGPFGPALVSIATEVLALVAAMKILSAVGSIVGRTFGIVRSEAIGATGAIEAEGVAAQTTASKNRLLGGIGIGKASILGGLAGGAIAGVSGGGPGDILGGILSGAGGVALATGNVPVGLALLLGGQLLPNVVGGGANNKEDQQALLDRNQAIAAGIAQYKTNQQAVDDLTKSQNDLGVSIQNLQKIQKPTIDDTNRLISLQQDYAQGVVDSINANKDLADSFSKLSPSLQALKTFTQTASSGGNFGASISAIQQNAIQSIIKATSPDFQEGGRFFGQDVSSIQSFQLTTPATYTPPPTPVSNETVGAYNALSDANKAAATSTQDLAGEQARLTAAYEAGTLGQMDYDIAMDKVIHAQELQGRTAALAAGQTNAQADAAGKAAVANDSNATSILRQAAAYAASFANKPYLPENASQFEQGRQFLPQTGSLIGENVVTKTQVDLSQIASGAESVKDIFNEAGDKIIAKFDLSNAAVAAVNVGIQLLKDKGDPLAATYERTWQKAIDGADAYSYVLDTVAKNIAVIQAQQELGILPDDIAKKLLAQQNIQAISAQQQASFPSAPRGDEGLASSELGISQRVKSQSLADQLIKNPDNAQAQKDFADFALKTLGFYDELLAAGPNALAEAESRYIEKVVGLTSVIQVETKAEQENAAAKQKNADVTKGYNSELQDLIKQRTGVEADLAGNRVKLSQTTDKGDRKQLLATIAAEQEQLDQINALVHANAVLKNTFISLDQQGLIAFRNSLKDVHGLEAITTVDVQNLSSYILGQAQAMGVGAAGVKQLEAELVKLAKIISLLDGLKASIKVEIDFAVGQLGKIGGTSNIGTDLLAQPGVGSQLAASASGQGPAASAAKGLQDDANDILNQIGNIFKSGTGSAFGKPPPTGGGGTKKQPVKINTSYLDIDQDILSSEQFGFSTQKQDIATIIANAKKLQAATPGAKEEDKNQLVQILDGTKVIATIRGISEERLRKSMDELAEIEKKRLDFETKADTIRRIRIGGAGIAAIANVPFNSANNISVGGAQGPITVDLNVNGQVLTPAQLENVSNIIAAKLKRAIAAG